MDLKGLDSAPFYFLLFCFFSGMEIVEFIRFLVSRKKKGNLSLVFIIASVMILTLALYLINVGSFIEFFVTHKIAAGIILVAGVVAGINIPLAGSLLIILFMFFLWGRSGLTEGYIPVKEDTVLLQATVLSLEPLNIEVTQDDYDFFAGLKSSALKGCIVHGQVFLPSIWLFLDQPVYFRYTYVDDGSQAETVPSVPDERSEGRGIRGLFYRLTLRAGLAEYRNVASESFVPGIFKRYTLSMEKNLKLNIRVQY